MFSLDRKTRDSENKVGIVRKPDSFLFTSVVFSSLSSVIVRLSEDLKRTVFVDND